MKTYAAYGLPFGLSFNAHTGVISGRPAFADAAERFSVDAASAEQDDEVEPDLLIDPPPPQPDDPQRPSGNTDH